MNTIAQEVEVVRQWHHALNTGNEERMETLVYQDVKMEGAHGVAQGVQVLRDWFRHAQVTLIPLRYFHRHQTVIVEEQGEWHSGTGEVTGSRIVASVFIVMHKRISSIMRYDDLSTAFEASGLDASDEVRLSEFDEPERSFI